MNHLLDSNVASESMKRMSDAAVLAWVDAQPPESLFLSAVSIGRAQVEDWIDLGMLELFRDRILPVTQRIADKWGRLDAPLVTRNVKFEVLGLKIRNPWSEVVS